METIKTEEEGEVLIGKLNACQAIPGFHRTPFTIEEIREAVRFSVDKDDYNEQRKNK